MRLWREASTRVLMVTAGFWSAAGVGLIALGAEENSGLVLRVGAGCLGLGVVNLFLLLLRSMGWLRERSRGLGAHLANHRLALGILLVGGGVMLAPPLILAGYNYIAWSAVERDCELALEAGDSAEGRQAYARGVAAMENPLLLIPSSLFDLWGPNRCRSAAERWRAGPQK